MSSENILRKKFVRAGTKASVYVWAPGFWRYGTLAEDYQRRDQRVRIRFADGTSESVEKMFVRVES